MDNDAVVEILNKEKGRAWDLARAIMDCKNASWQARNRCFAVLKSLLLEGKPKDLAAVFANGPHRLFEAAHGAEVAALAAGIASRMQLYVHSPSSWRRSFRSADPATYMDRFSNFLTDLLFFSWEHFDLIRDLSTPRAHDADASEDEQSSCFPVRFYGDLIALRLDERDQAVTNAVKEICLGDNNTKLLSDPIINGIVKSGSAELHKLLGDVLLAARLQEGLRQSILENADNGRVEAFLHLMKLVLENDLIRYSSALRAIDVWMGLGEGFEDKRVAARLLGLGYACLTDKKTLAAGLESKDVTEIYTALWALSVREMAEVEKPLKKLLQGEKYRRLVGLYFLNQTENEALQFAVASEIIHKAGKAGPNDPENDLDILSLALAQYPVDSYLSWEVRNGKNDFSASCRANSFLADKSVRDQQFAGLLHILSLLPQKGYAAQGKPFPWCSLSLTPLDTGNRLLNIAGYDLDAEKTRQLIEAASLLDSGCRALFVEYFLGRPASPAERAFVFASLNDKSMAVRLQALQNVLGFSGVKGKALSEEEEKLILGLLSLKTGDLRQNCIKILLALPGNRPLEAAQKLLADKNENKRLAGLDILTQLVNSGSLSRAEAAEAVALMPKQSDREQTIIKALAAEAPRFCKANGFGLYDPDYRPVFPDITSDPRHTLDSVFGLSPKRIRGLFSSLCDLIRENQDYTYTVEGWDGTWEEVKLGGQQWLRFTREKDKPPFESIVLQDLWRGWMQKNSLTFAELFYCMFAQEVKDYDDEYAPYYADWAAKIIKKLFRAKELDAFTCWKGKQEYGVLASNLLNLFWSEFPEEERFAVLAGLLTDLLGQVPEEDWQRPIEADEDGSASGDAALELVLDAEDELDEIIDQIEKDEKTSRKQGGEVDFFNDSEEVSFITRELQKAVKDDGRFAVLTAFCFELGRRSGLFYSNLSAVEIARGVGLGILKEDVLLRTMFLADEQNMGYAGKIRWDAYREEAEKYPLLKRCADQAAARVMEIELDRGDSPTEVSRLANAILWHEGAENFVRILTALGDETFVRGYMYYGSGDAGKKETFSHLLKVSHPSARDSAQSLRAALAGKSIGEKRLIEAAMYAPAWLDIVGDYIGWPGLKNTAWYFHAHINESFSAEKETEVARYSPISPEDFNDGAFDIDWFRDAWSTLGAERFDLVYDCAKYLTSGSNHRRAQLFADAVLGRLDKDTLAAEIHDKRNKDKLLAYSLIPLTRHPDRTEEVMAEALRRYEFIQQFLRESKSFGAQRRESEAKACAIAQDNLARNAGFADALRFAWRMESLKIAEIRSFFEPVDRSGYQVRVVIAEDGAASLVCEKDGKKLASVPAALKKDEYIASCKEVVASLKQQFLRARASLERAMINRDIFACGEIKTLMAHPVVAPLLTKLVFVTVDDKGAPQKSGVFRELEGQKDNASLRIAHPHDLFLLGTWLDCQKQAFENRLVQPFKQIFRELYLINDDEKQEKTASRRYAGHQVQPKKTVALLKSRGWTVDYEEGLQRVCYRENFYATLYAAADWFSPAETEAPTLETVRFFPRRAAPGSEFKALDLESIPPVIFSEVMRDIDLVVSVAHVGGVDPEASHSTVAMRAAIVRELLALLHIENVTVEASHAKITGKLGEYTVHLGSAQVHKMGRGALNILAVPSQHRGRVFLPFADEDPRTAEIMSKIIMLAEDATIKDPAILAQIAC